MCIGGGQGIAVIFERVFSLRFPKTRRSDPAGFFCTNLKITRTFAVRQ
jgi:hypothetical protein